MGLVMGRSIQPAAVEVRPEFRQRHPGAGMFDGGMARRVPHPERQIRPREAFTELVSIQDDARANLPTSVRFSVTARAVGRISKECRMVVETSATGGEELSPHGKTRAE